MVLRFELIWPLCDPLGGAKYLEYHRSMKCFMVCIVAGLLGACHAASPVTFSVRTVESISDRAVSGRLIIALAADSARIPPETSTLDAPFWDDEQPFYGMNVEALPPGGTAVVDASADAANVRLADLPPGHYRATARLIAHRNSSSWRNDPGNMFSDEVTFTLQPNAPVDIAIELNHATQAKPWPTISPGVELFETPSALLSAFHGRDVSMRAGIVFPSQYNPNRQYSAIYFVPGFGGDHTAALRMSRDSAALTDSADEAALARETFIIVLDPESANGHTLFANSANNGPCGDALVRELIPALESKYPLRSKPEARILRGHSSGGWSTLWLGLNYPQIFGAVWSSSPDPIDFRAFESVDIYADNNMLYRSGHHGSPGVEYPSFRRDGKEVMSVRQEISGERVLGPNQTSGQQWHSWMAVFGPRRGGVRVGKHPAALFDPDSGQIDHAVAEAYRKYDLGDLLRTNPERFRPLWDDRIRLVVGGEDSFYLERAVQLVDADLRRMRQELSAPPATGYVRVVAGYDHGSIFRSPDIRAFPSEMLTHLRQHECLSMSNTLN